MHPASEQALARLTADGLDWIDGVPDRHARDGVGIIRKNSRKARLYIRHGRAITHGDGHIGFAATRVTVRRRRGRWAPDDDEDGLEVIWPFDTPSASEVMNWLNGWEPPHLRGVLARVYPDAPPARTDSAGVLKRCIGYRYQIARPGGDVRSPEMLARWHRALRVCDVLLQERGWPESVKADCREVISVQTRYDLMFRGAIPCTPLDADHSRARRQVRAYYASRTFQDGAQGETSMAGPIIKKKAKKADDEDDANTKKKAASRGRDADDDADDDGDDDDAPAAPDVDADDDDDDAAAMPPAETPAVSGEGGKDVKAVRAPKRARAARRDAVENASGNGKVKSGGKKDKKGKKDEKKDKKIEVVGPKHDGRARPKLPREMNEKAQRRAGQMNEYKARKLEACKALTVGGKYVYQGPNPALNGKTATLEAIEPKGGVHLKFAGGETLLCSPFSIDVVRGAAAAQSGGGGKSNRKDRRGKMDKKDKK